MNTDYKKIAHVAALAGRIMLESQAECYRVENTVLHILKISQLPITQVFATTTGLFLMLDGPQLDQPITIVKRISRRETHLEKIYEVNQISRSLTANQLTIDKAEIVLRTIDQATYEVASPHLANFILVIAFAVVFGGNVGEVLLAALAGGLLISVLWLRSKLGLNSFITSTIATSLVTFVMTLLVKVIHHPEINIDFIIISAIMPLFPGTAFTNGFRDSFKGDFTAGLAKIVEAFVIATSLGIGVAFGLFLAKGVFLWLS